MSETGSPGLPAAVCLVVALRCEARPLIDRYCLERHDRASSPYEIWSGPSVALVVSGVGKLAAAAGTAYLAARMQDPSASAWLNVGIAGHPDLELGEVRLAHRVHDRASGRSWYPLPLSPDRTSGVPRSCEVITVDEVERAYPQPALYEMEAAGFVATASRCCDIERVQCLKVVSDSLDSPTEQLDRGRISRLIGQACPVVEAVVDRLRALVLEHSERITVDPAHVERYLDSFRLTVTQQRQLEVLLRRWVALDATAQLWSSSLEEARLAVQDGRLGRPGKRVLEMVRHEVERAEVSASILESPC